MYSAAIERIESEIFRVENPNTIFIATLSMSYRYEIYIDGLIYQKNKGQAIVPIKVQNGLHSVRVVKIWDTSDSRTTYELGTLQFDIQDNAVFCTAHNVLESHTVARFVEICSKEITGFSLKDNI